jgi:pyruvate formate-lyase activating enzyme-like uncharacterized protein
MVLLVTGRCHSDCFYCPLSESKRGHDVTYANERPVDSVEEAIEEAHLIDAEGTGVTGGDPVDALDRTVSMLKALKAEFGEAHHVHLYTSVPLSEDQLLVLSEAGLDEVRFHPPAETLANIDATGYPGSVAIAAKMGMEVGYEIPVLPDMKEELRVFLGSLVDDEGAPFVNLNELEFSSTNAEPLCEHGYTVRSDESAAVQDSEELGRLMVEEFAVSGLRVHYCSASFKDAIQLRNRLKRRAENVARPHELVTEDQTILKVVVECEDPGAVARDLMTRFDVPADLMVVDAERGVLELAAWVAEELEEEIDGECYLIEEYPTWDRLEVERVPVRQIRNG